MPSAPTGFTPFEFSTVTKWVEILKEIGPGVTRVATILNPVQSPQVGMLRAIETAAPSVGVLLTAAGVSDAAEIERAVSAFARESNGGLMVMPNPVTIGHRELIIALAARHRQVKVNEKRGENSPWESDRLARPEY